eukprot:scaffold43883_cov32-Tisochrysis_lutea.AAC.7
MSTEPKDVKWFRRWESHRHLSSAKRKISTICHGKQTKDFRGASRCASLQLLSGRLWERG